MTDPRQTQASESSSAASTKANTGKSKSVDNAPLTLTSLPAEVFEQIGFFVALCSNDAENASTEEASPQREGKSSSTSSIGCSAATQNLSLDAGSSNEENAAPEVAAQKSELPDGPDSLPVPVASSSGLSAKTITATEKKKEETLTAPSVLRNLLLVCRTVHERLSSASNARLYARIFRTRFDVAAVRRRYGRSAVSSRNLANELKRRYVALKRMRYAVEHEQYWAAADKAEASEEDITENLWIAYFMLIENDGLNMQQIKWAKVEEYVKLFQSQELLESAIRDGYPEATLSRALSMQINYLLIDMEEVQETNRDEDEERLFIMRPFVFAAHKYEAYLGPWTCRKMPLDVAEAAAAPEPESDASAAQTADNPFVANLRPKDNGYKMRYCGQDITMCPPFITHAACQAFFSKVERDPAVNGFNSIQDLYEENFEQVGAREAQEGETSAAGASTDADKALGNNTDTRQPHKCNPIAFKSLDHDKDVKRLMLCTSPSAKGFSHIPHVGSFEGSWEGRFTFFDFDSYRDMLGGKIRALYEGPFGEQPQVWKLREHIVKIDDPIIEGGKGNVLNAGYFDVDDEPARYKGVTAEEKKELHALAARHELFSDIEERDARLARKRDADTMNGEGNDKDDADAARDARERSRSYLAPSKTSSLTTDRYEVLLSGTGHSAWGRFVLRGRIRNWDGMVTMVKEYRPDGRGRWLYRGYVVAGNKFVGRWRDTFTPADMSGYEGCFQLHRRT